MERYQDLALETKRTHRVTKKTVISIVIGALGTRSKNAKAWYERFSLPDIFGSAQLSDCQPSMILLKSCAKCSVYMLQVAAETWLRLPQKIPEN